MSGLTRQDAADAAGRTYALLLADTVVVKPGGAPADVATALAPKDWKDVAYFVKVGRSGRAAGGGERGGRGPGARRQDHRKAQAWGGGEQV